MVFQQCFPEDYFQIQKGSAGHDKNCIQKNCVFQTHEYLRTDFRWQKNANDIRLIGGAI